MRQVIISDVNFVNFIVKNERNERLSNSIVVVMDDIDSSSYKALRGPNYLWMIVKDGNSLSYLIFFDSGKKKPLTKEDFIEVIATKCPDSFDWALFHPEIFEGIYLKDGGELYDGFGR